MKNQRWPGDDQTISQEFRSSKREEQMGMNDANKSHGNDFLAKQIPGSDYYERCELEPSWTTQLDTSGMQPHAREFVERDVVADRSHRKFYMIDGQMIDCCDGIQFSGTP